MPHCEQDTFSTVEQAAEKVPSEAKKRTSGAKAPLQTEHLRHG
jgi:hypothetical protein